jgi:hypothetical protein
MHRTSHDASLNLSYPSKDYNVEVSGEGKGQVWDYIDLNSSITRIRRLLRDILLLRNRESIERSGPLVAHLDPSACRVF